MASDKSVERKISDGRRQPTEAVALVNLFEIQDSSPIVLTDTFGSENRKNPGKQSQTLQFGEEAAAWLFDVLKQT